MTREKGFWGSGWSFPPTFNIANNQLQMTAGEENIQQSIDIILRTQRGERSFLPQWGIDLNDFLFKPLSGHLKGEICSAIKQALLNYEPRIQVLEVLIKQGENEGTRLEISIEYLIRKTNTRHNHIYPFSDIEGTNLVIPKVR